MKPSRDAQNHARGSEGYHTSGNVERGPRQGERGRECNAIFCVAKVRVGSKLEITAPQHWHPLHPSEQTLCAQNGGCTATLILWRELPQGLLAVNQILISVSLGG